MSPEPRETPSTGRASAGELPRAAVILVTAAAAVIAIAGVRGAAGLVGPVFLALVITIVAHPAQAYAQRRGWPSWTGVISGIAIAFSLILGLSLALVASLGRMATLLPTYADDAQETLNDLTDTLQDAGVGADQRQTIASGFDLEKLIGWILDLLGSLASLSSNLFFVSTLLLFMIVDASSFPARLRATGSQRRDLVSALGSFADGTRRYLVVSSIFGFIVAVIDTAVLALLGVPAPFVWGLLAFITNYIPNIGFVIGLVPPALLALLEGGLDLMLLVIAIYCVVNFIIQSLIQPKFVGDAVGLSGTMTMLSLVFWAWVLGAVGALLAIPLTLLVKAVLVDADPRARWLLPVLAGSPGPPTDDPLIDPPIDPPIDQPGNQSASQAGSHLDSRSSSQAGEPPAGNSPV